MDPNFKSRYRNWGEEQRYIPFLGFKLRLPFLHFRFELPEFVQGFILVAVALSAAAPLMEGLALAGLVNGNEALAFQIAVVLVMINAVILLIHCCLGDPVIPGWITPALPLTLVYLAGFDDPVSRLHAMRALQFVITIMFLVLGLTGMAKKIVSIVPVSIRSGVLLGAAIVAIQGVIAPGGRMEGSEVSTIVGVVITFLVLYSFRYRRVAGKSAILRYMATYGLLPGMIVAMAVGMIIGELPVPTLEWGLTPMPFGETFRALSVFTHGLPPLSFFIAGIPLAAACYIISFGDIVTAEAIVKEADKVRADEKIVFNADKSHIFLAARNFIQAATGPFVPMSGPIWTGGQIATVERYRAGPKSMDSLFGGIFWYPFGKVVALCLAFIVSGLAPVLPVALSITMVVSGWAAGYIAFQMAKTREEQGIALLVGSAIAFRGAAVGLGVGVALHLIIGAVKKSNEEKE